MNLIKDSYQIMGSVFFVLSGLSVLMRRLDLAFYSILLSSGLAIYSVFGFEQYKDQKNLNS